MLKIHGVMEYLNRGSVQNGDFDLRRDKLGLVDVELYLRPRRCHKLNSCEQSCRLRA